MPSSGTLFGLAAALGSANAAFQGFNYGATFTDGSLKMQADYEADFKAAANLPGTDGAFTSARLYTMVQGNTDNQPNEAIAAAIKTKTSLLLGMWASGGTFDNEIAALKNTIDQYCGQLDDLIAGISVGSEDLYRNSEIGQKNGELVGEQPDVLVDYIKKTRDAIKGSCLSDAPIGHVDTWTAYVNGTNNPVIEACDWIGMDAYPYFENTKPNSIENGEDLLQTALDNTKGAIGDKEIWITETGWPVSGKTSRDAVASPKNARTFWEEAGCSRFGKQNVWWYTLQDSAPDTPNPSFGVIGSDLNSKPLYDLSCKNVKPKPDPETTSNPGKAATTDSQPSSSSDAEATTSAADWSSQAEETTSAGGDFTTTIGGGGGIGGGVGGGNGSSSPNTTMATPAPTTTDSGSGSDDGGSGGSPTGDGSSSNPTTSTVPDGSNQLNSFSAAAVAIVLAAFAL